MNPGVRARPVAFAFTVALLVAGSAPNENVLIGARICQGAVAGVMQPLSMYVLFRVFPPARRGMAMGLFGMSVILGPASGRRSAAS